MLFGYASGTVTQLSAGDLFGRGLTASAAIGPRILQRPGGMRELEERALAAAADGSLTPAVQRFPLAEAAAAHAALETPRDDRQGRADPVALRNVRVAALYDIHGNVPALDAVLADVERPAST